MQDPHTHLIHVESVFGLIVHTDGDIWVEHETANVNRLSFRGLRSNGRYGWQTAGGEGTRGQDGWSCD